MRLALWLFFVAVDKYQHVTGFYTLSGESLGRSAITYKNLLITSEHYLPLLHILALKEEQEDAVLFNDKAGGGSISMTSV